MQDALQSSTEKFVNAKNNAGEFLSSDGLSAPVDFGSPIFPTHWICADLQHIVRNIQNPVFGNASLREQRCFDSGVVTNARVRYLDEKENVLRRRFECAEKFRQRFAYDHVRFRLGHFINKHLILNADDHRFAEFGCEYTVQFVHPAAMPASRIGHFNDLSTIMYVTPGGKSFVVISL